MLLFIIVDYIALVLAQETAYQIRELFQGFLPTVFVLPINYQFIYIPLVFILCIAVQSGYEFNRPSLDVSQGVFKGLLFGMVMSIIILFVINASGKVSRLFCFLFVFTSLGWVATLRYAVSKFIKGSTLLKEEIIVIGAGKTAERIKAYFDKDLAYRYEIVGLIDDNPISDELPSEYPLLGKMDEAAKIVQDMDIYTVLVSAPGMDKDKMDQLLTDIRPYVRNILFAPNLVGTPMGSVQIQTLFSEQITLLKSYNNLARVRSRVLKRLFDFFFTLTFMPIIIPILFVLGVIIKIDSKGSVFYNAQRLGENGKNFTCYKFRSMYTDGDERLKKYLAENPEAAAEWKEFAKLRGYDPRVTKAGRWMRRTSLDELPQLLNVLEGTMSLVGPRPYLPREKEDMGADVEIITMAKPGITGFWQINGRNDVTFADRVAMDVWYVKNWSLARDIMFLAKTFKIVLGKSGAY